jgi:hypothetical protein
MKYLLGLLLVVSVSQAQEKHIPTKKEIETCIVYCALKPEEKNKLSSDNKFKVCGDCSNACFKDESCILEIEEDLEYHKKGK